MAENRHPADHDAPLPNLDNTEVRHEVGDVNEWAVGKFGIALALVCVGVLALLMGIFHFFLMQTGGQPPSRVQQGLNLDSREVPPQPRLQVSDILDMQEMRAAEEKVLNSYGWVDKGSGTVRLPIDRAMDILAQRGLPARQTNGPISAAANVTVPAEQGLGPVMQQPGGPLAPELYGGQAGAQNASSVPAAGGQNAAGAAGTTPSAPPLQGPPSRQGAPQIAPGVLPPGNRGVAPYPGGSSNKPLSKGGGR